MPAFLRNPFYNSFQLARCGAYCQEQVVGKAARDCMLRSFEELHQFLRNDKVSAPILLRSRSMLAAQGKRRAGTNSCVTLRCGNGAWVAEREAAVAKDYDNADVFSPLSLPSVEEI